MTIECDLGVVSTDGGTRRYTLIIQEVRAKASDMKWFTQAGLKLHHTLSDMNYTKAACLFLVDCGGCHICFLKQQDFADLKT